MTITKLEAIEIISSKSLPTLEIAITLNDKFKGNAIIPLDLNDLGSDINEMYSRIKKEKSSLENFVLKGLWNKQFNEQTEFDEYLEKFFRNYQSSGFNGNMTFAISSAFLKASSFSHDLLPYEYAAQLFQIAPVIPKPLIKILHNTNESCIAEDFFILPKFAKFSLSMEFGVKIYNTMKDLLENDSINANLSNDDAAIELIENAMGTLKLKPDNFEIIAAVRKTSNERIRALESKELIKGIILEESLKRDEDINYEDVNYIISPLHAESDREKMKEALKNRLVNVVAVDLSKSKTVSDAFLVTHMSHSVGCKSLVFCSDSSEDSFYSHLAFGTAAEFVMFGEIDKLENIIKYNEIARIENSLK